VAKLKAQVPDEPELQLLFAMWARDILDAYRPVPAGTSNAELRALGKMRASFDRAMTDTVPLELAGVKPAYMRRVVDTLNRQLPQDQQPPTGDLT
jgi:hypothetical protein